MTQLAVSSPVPVRLDLGEAFRLSDDELFELCARNKDLRIERTAEGDLIVMTPAGFRTGNRNAKITAALTIWAEAEGSGVAVDSSTGFRLPNGAMRAPDAAWVRSSRLESVPVDEQEKFLPLTPDFVIELISPSDEVADVQAKMQEYVAGGAQLGWLIDPFGKRVYVYRPGEVAEILEQPSELSGDPELPGFAFDLRPIWESA